MNKDEVSSIIEAALRSGSRTPGLFDLPKILHLKSRLQSCNSISDVLGIIQEHRNLIAKAFGLSDEQINETLGKLKALGH
ncbi:MAG TPA: hypothetical protein VIU93_10435 [Gallionellaceae bacterium]